jgi:DNA modification methylase
MTATVLLGNCLDVLKTLDSESVQCCVTSPPYYGLRDYGTAKWEGGDLACDHKNNRWPPQNINKSAELPVRASIGMDVNLCPNGCGAIRTDNQIGLEQTPELYVENLVSVFREVRRVLKDDGVLWLNLGDSYWGGKGQSSQAWSTEHQDRDTLEKAQHQITGKGETRPTDGKHPIIKPKDLIGIPWMVAFALRADGWYLRSDIIWHKPNPMPESVRDRPTKSHEYIFLLSKSAHYYYDHQAIQEPFTSKPTKPRDKRNEGYGAAFLTPVGKGFRSGYEQGARNKRDVWTVNTKPYKGAHFAVFPDTLIEPCILAGSRVGDTVLDPFSGSGTTVAVALKHGRNGIGIDLNPAYIELTNDRLSKVQVEF